MKKQYDIIFSLGEACFTASVLKSLGLRRFSAPFDWMYGATFKERFELFLNDFKHFIEKEDLKYVGERFDPEPCDIYKNERTGIVFNHDFPLHGNYQRDFPKVYEKYQRRIKRLLETIQKSTSVLIVYIDIAESPRQAKDTDEMIRLIELANQKYPNSGIDLLYIQHNEQMKDKEYIILSPHERVMCVQCFNRNRKSKVNSSGNYRNVSKILNSFKVHKTFAEKRTDFIHHLLSLPKWTFSIKKKLDKIYIIIFGMHLNLTKILNILGCRRKLK